MPQDGMAASPDLAAVEERLRKAESVPTHRRALTVRFFLKGKKPDEIAEAVGVSLAHVKTTLADWKRRGMAALAGRPQGGRHHAYLMQTEEAELLAGLRPKAEKGTILVVADVHQALEKRLGVPVSLQTVYDLLARHGWRKVKPRPRHVKADPAAQEAFKKTTFPAVAAEAAREAATRGRPLRVMFMDEGRFGLLPDARSCWAPPGVRPVVPVQIVREYTYAYAAVGPLDGAMDSLIFPTVNTDLMSHFLAFVADRHPTDYVLMVLDGAGWHEGANDLVVPSQMRLLTLPPYSPELDPAEHVWDEVREKRFANRVYQDLEAVEDDLAEELRRLQLDPTRVAGFAGFEWVTKTLRALPSIEMVAGQV